METFPASVLVNVAVNLETSLLQAAGQLRNLAEGRLNNLPLFQARFDTPFTLPVDFERLLMAFTHEPAEALFQETMVTGSPLLNRVNIVCAGDIHHLLHEQQTTLATIVRTGDQPGSTAGSDRPRPPSRSRPVR